MSVMNSSDGTAVDGQRVDPETNVPGLRAVELVGTRWSITFKNEDLAVVCGLQSGRPNAAC